MNILVIDDDLGIRETLGMALEANGHNVESVVNCAAAEKKLRQKSFEVAFLDLRLGSENGMDLLPELLRLSPRLAVILITAYSSVETAVLAIQKGAFDYLPKPFKPSQINQVLERVARTRDLEVRVADLEGRLLKPAEDVDSGNYVRSRREEPFADCRQKRGLGCLYSDFRRKRNREEHACAKDSRPKQARGRTLHDGELSQPFAGTLGK